MELRLKLMLFWSCLMILCCFLGEGASISTGGKGGSRQYRQTRVNNAYYNGEDNTKSREVESGPGRTYSRPQLKKAISGSGLSAWGIISIILSLIFIGFAIYYTYLLYPILCKKERQYNTIELVAV